MHGGEHRRGAWILGRPTQLDAALAVASRPSLGPTLQGECLKNSAAIVGRPADDWKVLSVDRDEWRIHERAIVNSFLPMRNTPTVPRGRFITGDSPPDLKSS